VIPRKALIVALAVVGSLLFTGCSFVADNPQVKYVNGIIGFNIGYGVRLGEAEYVGSLDYGQSTPYLETIAGAYVLQARTASGEWLPFSTGVLWVCIDHTYTLTMVGEWDPGLAVFIVEPTISLIQDS
jgi:hypothetical protein